MLECFEDFITHYLGLKPLSLTELTDQRLDSHSIGQDLNDKAKEKCVDQNFQPIKSHKFLKIFLLRPE